MSEATMPAPKLNQRSLARRLRDSGFDPWLLMTVSFMILFGLVMVYSSSWDVSWRLTGEADTLFRRQVINMGIGLLAMVAAAQVPLAWLRKLAIPIIAVAIVSLLAVLLFSVGLGPRRAFLSGSIQPSELAKLALIIYLAVWMESKGDKLLDWGHGFIPLMVIIGIVGGLILLQPDLSAVLTVAVVALTLFYLAGARLSQSLIITSGGSVVAYILVRLTTTGRARWADYISGLVDIQQASYHVQHSLQAFYSGGILGLGLGASREKFGLLPAPHTDSIYAVIGEELGLIGALVVVAMFVFFLWRGFRIALDSEDRLGYLIASGITFWIGVEAMVNMSVLLGLLPFAGNALPFFSFGGSSLVTTLAGVGLLLNVSRRKTTKEDDIRGAIASFDIGRRNRRRRVSRLGRSRRARREG
jgi:cell division protein FtsW